MISTTCYVAKVTKTQLTSFSDYSQSIQPFFPTGTSPFTHLPHNNHSIELICPLLNSPSDLCPILIS